MKLLLVMPTKYLGNMVISMQTIAALLASKADATQKVTLLIDGSFEDVSRLAFGDDCNYLVFPRADERGHMNRLARLVRFSVALRQQKFDCALDIDGSVVAGRVTAIAKADEKIGPSFAKRPHAYSRLITVDRDEHHCFDDFRLMAEAIGTRVTDRQYMRLPAIEPRPRIPSDVLPADDRPVVCIHPCATKDYKEWDVFRFAELADRLISNGWHVVIVGAGHREKARVSRMLASMQETPANAHGRLSITDLVHVLHQSTAFIGNDSGPMHLAAATGVPVIALFGPTELFRWEPRTDRLEVLKGPLPCSPNCQTEACLADYQCLRSLTVDQVETAAHSFLSQKMTSRLA